MAALPDSRPNRSQLVRFGTFEVNLKAGELRRNGNRIRLQEQPFQILSMLLDRPGEVVTRDELRGRLWPANTYVDFDHSLNAAVRRLRDALGDSAENPRFVETVARRGYRLLVPVVHSGPATDTTAVSPVSLPEMVAKRGLFRSHLGWIAAAAVAVVVLVTGLAIGWRLGQRSSATTLALPHRLTANPSNAPVLSAAISSDGKYLAYSDKTGMYLRQVQTGETHPITAQEGSPFFPVGWFPDGTHLLALRVTGAKDETSIWSVSILGGPARKLADNAVGPSPSPDGRSIAFLRGFKNPAELWLMQADGSRPRRLLGDPGAFLDSPTWAPDGRHLAFLSGKFHPGSFSMDAQIQSVDVASGRVETVLARSGLDGGLTWTRSGRLVFSLHENEPNQEDSNLWYIAIDSASARPLGPPTQITRDTGAAHSVSTTSDNRLIFFRSSWQPDVYVAEIEAGGARISAPRLLTLDERSDFPYAWTPDSRSIIFASDRDGDYHLFRQAPDQATPELVLGGDQRAQIPRLNPDRSALLYLVTPKTGDSSTRVRLMRLPLAGGPPEQVLEADGISNHQCAFLPSTFCVYSIMGPHQIRFYQFDSVTGTSRELPQWKLENADSYKFNWSLSPDGRTIAISGQQATAITLKSTSGGSERTIPLSSWAGLASLDWAADGQSLWATVYNLPTDYALVNVDLRGHIKTVLEDQEMRIGWAIPSPDGRRLALWKASGDSNVWMIDKF